MIAATYNLRYSRGMAPPFVPKAEKQNDDDDEFDDDGY